MSPKAELRIDWATHEAAKFAVENWHYSRTMPTNKLAKVGVWEGGAFIGVVIFGPGATPTLCKTYKLTQQECCELVRVALRKHETSVTRIIAIALKFLKRSNPGLKLVISFADTSEGHHGGIYQGGGWIYVGEAGPRKLPFLNGRRIHERSLSIMVKSGKATRAECVWRPAMPKHKYLMPLDDDMRRQIEPLRKPYPKRAVSIVADASEFHSEEGGSVPTTALQSNEAKHG